MKSAPPLLVFGPILSAILVILGFLSGSLELTYWASGAISGVLACYTGWRFIKGYDGPANLLFYGGTFLFYYLQLLTPDYWADFSQTIVEYSLESRLMSALGTSLLPLACLMVARLLERVWPTDDLAVEDRAVAFNTRRILLGYLVLFALVAIPNVLFGDVLVSSLNAIIYMRGLQETHSVIVPDQQASITSLQHFSSSLLVLTWVLYRTPYRRIVLVLSPLSVIWALGSVLGTGTRTQVLQFGFAVLVSLLSRLRLKTKMVAVGTFVVLVFTMAQIMTYYRSIGIREVQFSDFTENVGAIQGLETMHDQTRAMEMFVEGYVSPATTGVAPIDLVIGLVYRPIEFLMFPLPRSFFSWKPTDPTVIDLARWSISRMGIDPDRYLWGITGGLLGRDTLRWGSLGALVAVFWFSAICWFADREARRDRSSITQQIIAGAFAGSAISMYRDLSPLWCLQLLPAAFVLIYARIRAPRECGPTHAAYHV